MRAFIGCAVLSLAIGLFAASWAQADEVKPNQTIEFTADRTVDESEVTVASPTFTPPSNYLFRKVDEESYINITAPSLEWCEPLKSPDSETEVGATVFPYEEIAGGYRLHVGGFLRRPGSGGGGGGGGGGAVTWSALERAERNRLAIEAVIIPPRIPIAGVYVFTDKDYDPRIVLLVGDLFNPDGTPTNSAPFNSMLRLETNDPDQIQQSDHISFDKTTWNVTLDNEALAVIPGQETEGPLSGNHLIGYNIDTTNHTIVSKILTVTAEGTEKYRDANGNEQIRPFEVIATAEIMIVRVRFTEHDQQAYGIDEHTPAQGPYKSVRHLHTDTAIAQSGAGIDPPDVFFTSADENAVSIAPAQATSANQIVTVEGKQIVNTRDVHARLDAVDGDIAAKMRVRVYEQKERRVAVRRINAPGLPAPEIDEQALQSYLNGTIFNQAVIHVNLVVLPPLEVAYDLNENDALMYPAFDAAEYDMIKAAEPAAGQFDVIVHLVNAIWPPRFAGWADEPGPWAVVSGARPDVVHVIAHELGHTFGLGHRSTDGAALMHPYSPGTYLRYKEWERIHEVINAE